jgi:hypothetical protein
VAARIIAAPAGPECIAPLPKSVVSSSANIQDRQIKPKKKFGDVVGMGFWVICPAPAAISALAAPCSLPLRL